jgi:hypothetical protein
LEKEATAAGREAENSGRPKIKTLGSELGESDIFRVGPAEPFSMPGPNEAFSDTASLVSDSTFNTQFVRKTLNASGSPARGNFAENI